MTEPGDRRSLIGMTGYIRPHIESVEFFDDAGRVIDYGNRWADTDGQPPEDRYEVETHLERFAPLHTVAEALIEHLVQTYDVSIEEGAHVCVDFRYPPSLEDVVRAVRLTPADPLAAPLTMVLTDYPGVLVFAGVLTDFVYPTCGCDACDEDWKSMAERLEAQVLGVVAGGLREFVSRPRLPQLRCERGMGVTVGMGQTVGYRLERPEDHGWEGGESRAKDLPKPELKRISARLAEVNAGTENGAWRPWKRAEKQG